MCFFSHSTHFPHMSRPVFPIYHKHLFLRCFFSLTHPFPPYVTPHFPYISRAFIFEVLCISGEPFPTSLAARTLALLPHVTLLNLYGATEVSADVACFNVTREALQIQSHSEMIDSQLPPSQLPPSQLPAPLYEGNHTLKKSNPRGTVPLGYALGAAELVLARVDGATEGTADGADGTADGASLALATGGELALAAAGDYGEICVVGTAVAHGYIERRSLDGRFVEGAEGGVEGGALDASRFVTLADGRRCFKTRDLGRWLTVEEVD